jgi:FkbM family methyltransferase
LVVTLATIPSRISQIGPVIDSIKAQTRRPDRIYVCICEFCLWERSPYDVPGWLRHDNGVDVVVSAKDYGPANKLIGMLDKEPDPSTRIVIVDDDWAYGPDMLQVLERRFEEFGRAAIGSSGARLPRYWSGMEARIGREIDAKPQPRRQLIFVADSPRDVPVDILQYGFGAMVLRGWFDDDIRDLLEPLEPLFFADDVLFSGYLESRGIQRICIAGLPLPRLLDHWNTRPLHGDGRATRNYKAAIPALSARLNIWAPESLLDPHPPLRALLRELVSRALHAAHRLGIRLAVLFAQCGARGRAEMTARSETPWRYRVALLKSKCLYQYVPGRFRAMKALYGSMVSAGDLCFDLGSHIGNRVDVLTSLGCKVVALEPHPFLASYLRRRFSANPDVVIDERAVNHSSGDATLHWSPRFLSVSSIEPGWVDSLQALRSHNIAFTESQTVRTTTIGELIREYGEPRYCKIDVEGSDLAVIRSMPIPISIVSFEHLPHRFDATAMSLAALSELADYRYNYFVRESHRFRIPMPVSAEDLLLELRGIAGRGWACDVFAFRHGRA